MKTKVVPYRDTAVEALGGGVTRRVLAHLPEQMVVEVAFDQSATGAVHTHPHVQCTYVLKGEFLFTIEGEDHLVRAGDTIAFAPNEAHGCVCRQAGVLLDVFTPMRDDFLA